MNTNYISLHNHTTYSIMDSLIKPTELFKKIKELGQSAVAVTDHSSLAGAWDCLKYSKEAGVKLIMGCEFNFVDDLTQTDQRLRHVILLAKNHIGYKNLLQISKLANDNHIIAFKKVYPRIDWNILEKYSEGLICTTACSGGILGQLICTRRIDVAKEQAKRLKEIFGENLALEIQPHAMTRQANSYNDYVDQRLVNNQLIKFGKELDIKIVPTTNAHYLTKDQWEAHDVLLAIGAGQPIKSGARLKYTNDFYVKTREEIRDFFARLYPAQIDEWLDNTLYFANLCEEPDWIDPKFSNPTGKELPEFPVKDQRDYIHFLAWREAPGLSEEENEYVQKCADDVAYLRYWCYKNFDNKVPSDKHKEYNERLREEFDVIEYHGFSSYMLIVADYIDFCRKNNIPVGPGRGCLTKDTLVLTSGGFKKLPEINIDDLVFTHTGKLQKVLNKFEYPVSEELLKIKTDFSFNEIVLTKDHRLYASKANETERYKNFSENNLKSVKKIKRWNKLENPSWIEAKHLSENDYIFMTYPNINNDTYVYDDFDLTSESLYFLGRWVGDGWFYYHPKLGYQIGIAFNSGDKKGIQRISNFLKNLGYNVKLDKHKTKDLIQLKVHNMDLQNKLKRIFPQYENSSDSKHLPIFFRKLSSNQLTHLIQGVINSDGHIERGKRHVVRENIDSTSLRLILELKESLLYLKIPSSINTRKPYKRGAYNCKQSYKLRFKGCFTKKSKNNTKENGYFCKIKQISPAFENKVYDIHVQNDTSYLTTNYAVHNSVGGSLIGYLTGIHQADPIKYKLIFARFHNKEKTSFPDIDSDFAPSGREQVQEYIRKKYGADRVAHVSNINTMTPKVYARDIARVFQYGGDHKAAVAAGNQLADSIPGDVKSMDSVFEKAPLFAEMADKKYPELKKYANLLASKTKAWSTHAGGLVIGRRPLAEIVPLRRDKEGSVAIEYEKERAEANGLVKMDTLGLETLDIIRETNLLIAINGKKVPEPFDYEQYDEKTYDLISRGNTLCVFQFGTSAGTVDLCRRVRPRNLWDLALINALARPSAKDLRDDFIKIRNGEKELELLHPSMGPAFKQTFGLFEECLMFLAKDVADWDLHYADNLRKMTKEKGKNPKKVAGWRKEFIANAVANNGIPESIATKIWDDVIDKFQGYGFNMPHALLYSMISFHTAYLKAHFPLEFLTANLISEVKSNAKISADNILKIKDEIRQHKVKILPPDLNRSEMTYKIIDDGTLLTGLDSLKFIGKDAIPEIMAKRPFKSFNDFLTKVDGKKVRAPSVCALAASGCLDIYNMPRKQMFLYAGDFKKKLQVWNKKERQGEFQYPFPEVGEWNSSEKFAMENYYLGEGLSGNLFEIYPGFFDNKACDFSKLASFFPPGLKEQEYWVGANYGTLQGVVKSVFEFKVKKEGSKIFGQTMARVVVADPQGHTITLTIFPDRLTELKKNFKALHGSKMQLEPGAALHFAGYVNWYEGDISILFEGVKKCTPPPAMPSDLKARKVSMRISGGTRKKSKNIPDPEILLDEIEEELDEEGLSEPEEEYENPGELWEPGNPDGFI